MKGWLSSFGLHYRGRWVTIAAAVALTWWDLYAWAEMIWRKGPVIS